MKSIKIKRTIPPSKGPRMKTPFFTNNDFTYFAEVSKVEVLDNAYHLKISSQWRTAKNPLHEHKQFETTCTKEDLRKLAWLIEQVTSNEKAVSDD